MGHSAMETPRAVRRRLKQLAQRPSEHGRRAHAILLLWQTDSCVAGVARRLDAARSPVQRLRALYEEYGEQGLRPLDRGRSEYKTNDEVLVSLAALIDTSPREYCYLSGHHGHVRLPSGCPFESLILQIRVPGHLQPYESLGNAGKMTWRNFSVLNTSLTSAFLGTSRPSALTLEVGSLSIRSLYSGSP
jgi:hypothetical protein